MKSTIYIVEITNQKNEKYLLWGEIQLLARRVSTKKFFAWVYWKVFCRFWLIKPRELSHEASAAPIFLGIFFFHSFYGMTLRF